MEQQVVTRANQLDKRIYLGRTLEEFAENPKIDDLRKFGDRSIAKEVDQILGHIRRDPPEDSDDVNTLELTFRFDQNKRRKFKFDQDDAITFHRTVSRRDLGEPLRYLGTLRSLDRGRAGLRGQKPKAKLTLVQNNRDIVLHIGSQKDYDELSPYMQGERVIEIFASPILEFNSFDPYSGDAFFIRMA